MKTQAIEKKSSWWCKTCNANTEMNFVEAKNHLRDVHGIDTSKVKAMRRMLVHMDGEGWYETQYAVEIGKVVLFNTVTTERTKRC